MYFNSIIAIVIRTSLHSLPSSVFNPGGKGVAVLLAVGVPVLLDVSVAVLLDVGVAVILGVSVAGVVLAVIGVLSFCPAEFTATTLMV